MSCSGEDIGVVRRASGRDAMREGSMVRGWGCWQSVCSLQSTGSRAIVMVMSGAVGDCVVLLWRGEGSHEGCSCLEREGDELAEEDDGGRS